MNTPKLPPLPHWCEPGSPFAEQMQAYAIAAIQAQGAPNKWREFVAEVVASAESYERRTGKKVNAEWVERGRALLTSTPPAPQAQGVPDGWQLVPKEPTDAMIRAALHLDLSYMPGHDGPDRAAVYKAMLASAPPAPQAERCKVCNYQHGHQIGCENNPVDIALKAQASVVQQEQIAAEWVERWHGSRTEEGWSILFQSLVPRDKVAYLGTGVSAEAVQAIVLAHNKAIAAQQAKPQPLSAREIWDNDAIMTVNADAQLPFELVERFVRAVEAAHGIGEKK